MAFFRKKQEPRPSAPPEGDHIRSLQMRRDQELHALGEVYFTSAVKGQPDARALARKVREIQRLDQRLVALRSPPPATPKPALPDGRAARPGNCSCGHPLAGNDRFCAQCGAPGPASAPAGKPCPACHRGVDPGSAFCPHCGASTQGPARLRVRHPFTGQEASFDFQPGLLQLPIPGAGSIDPGDEPATAFAAAAAGEPAPPEPASEEEKRQWMRELERFARPPQVDTQAFLARGREFLQVGRYREAAAEFEACIVQSPRDGRAQYYLGVARYKNGEVDAALDAFQRSTRLDRSNPDAHNDLGLCYVKQGMWRDALQSYQDALKIAPHHCDAHYNVAQLHIHQVSYGDAIRHLQAYLQYSPRARDFKQVSEMIERLQAASATGSTLASGPGLPQH